MATTLALSLAACGGSSSSSSAAASSSAAGSEAASGAASTGLPEGYPTQDITYINAFAAGSSYDVYFRLLTEKVREMEGWEHSIVVEYKEGASGDVGWTALAQAEPDGYTIGFFPTAALINGVAAANAPEVVAKAEEMQLPVMTMDAEECKTLFVETEQSYKDLWATNPWQ